MISAIVQIKLNRIKKVLEGVRGEDRLAMIDKLKGKVIDKLITNGFELKVDIKDLFSFLPSLISSYEINSRENLSRLLDESLDEFVKEENLRIYTQTKGG